MLKNYLKIALRNMNRYKGYSVINITGLAIGMACCMLILLYVYDELSFDRYNKNSNRIYRLVVERKAPERISMDISTPPPLAPALVNDFPQIIHAVRFLNPDNPIPTVGYGSKRFYEKQFYFVDQDVFDVFTIPFLQGDPKTALQKPDAVVVTEEIARKYFGKINILGKTLTFNNFLDLEVTGVVQNSPANSTVRLDFLTSFSTLYGWLGKEFIDNWQNNMCQTYILLSENSSVEILAQQLPGFINKYLGEGNSLNRIQLQPLNRIHLFSYQDYHLPSAGNIQYVYLLSAVAIFVLLIAYINFINLSTARSVHRSREIGIRKVAGATKRQLIQQFLGEALLLTILALLIAIIIIELSIPHFNALIGRALTVNYIHNWALWLGLVGIGLLVGILSGSYPAFLLSSFKTVYTLKEHLKTGLNRVIFRKTLVVIQFTFTITLIIGTWVVHNQLKFIQNQPLGFDRDQVMVVPIREDNLRRNPEPLKSRLLQQPGILQVGAAALLPGGPVGKTRFSANGITGSMSMLWVDQDFISTIGIKLVAGRDFSRDIVTDASEAFIINEEAVKQLGWNAPADAIGKSFELVQGKKGTIIGVVKDFNFSSLHSKIEPILLHIWPWSNYILVRVDATHLPGILSELTVIWQEMDPDDPFLFSFLDDNFNRFYQSEKQFGQAAGYFTLLAILIACSGLFGLAAFTTEQRTKEIGVRKVLGATIPGIVLLLSKDFTKCVLIANIIAWPIAYYAMNKWLQNFAYRINIGIWSFFLAGVLALVIALLTVSYQSIKAAVANPVESLRYE